MEPPHDPLLDPAGAELVVLNGRLSGERRPLTLPLTLLGREATCDVWLNMDDVEPYHCALVQSPDGWFLRALGGVSSLVNGQPANGAYLADGDTLTVGPFHFLLCLPEAPAIPGQRIQEKDILERERDALRIQAAAVVAQQAALGEEEAKLEQRRVGLERQEEQLAAHLEDRRGRLLELQRQVRQARTALQQERTEHDQRIVSQLREVEKQRGEVTVAQQEAQAERQRLHRLRQKLKKRHEEALAAERAALRGREQKLGREQQQLQQETERLEQERATLLQARLRFNGDVEVGRRQLQSGWEDLHRQQGRWQEERNHGQAELQEQQREAQRREVALVEAERTLAEHWQQWEEMRHGLEKEIEGLENRVRNYRRKLTEQEQELLRLEHGVADAAPLPVPTETDVAPNRAAAVTGRTLPALMESRLPDLEKLAGELADQRLHLAEQFERLVLAQQQWRQDHEAVVADLDVVAQRLTQRELTVALREDTLAAREETVRQRQEEAADLHHQIDGWLGRVTAREAAWKGERERVLGEVRTREELLQGQWLALVDLRRRWMQRRRQELKDLRAEYQRCDGFRQQYAALWEECFRRRTELEQRERAAAELALALEQQRLEMLGQSEDSAAAERQLERLRRGWVALGAKAGQNLARDRKAVAAEAARLRAQAQHLHQRLGAVSKHEERVAEQQAAWEHEQTLAEHADARLRQELQSLQAQRDQYERQLAELNDEVERIARTLIEGAEPPPLTVARAA